MVADAFHLPAWLAGCGSHPWVSKVSASPWICCSAAAALALWPDRKDKSYVCSSKVLFWCLGHSKHPSLYIYKTLTSYHIILLHYLVTEITVFLIALCNIIVSKAVHDCGCSNRSCLPLPSVRARQINALHMLFQNMPHLLNGI
jgi:hypothetical protein